MAFLSNSFSLELPRKVGYIGLTKRFGMVYTGKVKGGVVLMDKMSTLAEGTVVRIVPIVGREPRRRPAPGSLGATLLEFAGKAKGLPRDLAMNHDHYLYGTTKR